VIVLDTNVVSELMRPEPHPAVLSWAGKQPLAALHTTAVTQAEVLYSVALLPAGERREALAAAADAIFAQEVAGRVLPFDGAAAELFAGVVAARRRAGNPIENFDAQIAAIALAVGASLATGGSAGCGLALVDPWQAG
jgi:hypothetical protein